jgi:hypothetical protein
MTLQRPGYGFISDFHEVHCQDTGPRATLTVHNISQQVAMIVAARVR